MNSTWTTLESSTFFQNSIAMADGHSEKGNSVLNTWDHKKTEDKNKNIIDSNRTAPKNIEAVWKLKSAATATSTTATPKPETSTKTSTKTSWSSETLDDREESEDMLKDEDMDEGNDGAAGDASANSNEPAHHSRRPMNAFLIFCKCHRPVVRQKYPQLENRGVTKILGEWWAQLEADEKTAYQDLAKEYKDAFFKANPNFRWYKLPAPPLRTLNTRPGNVSKSPEPKMATSPSLTPLEAEFTPGKLADESQLGSITSLMNMDSQFSKSTTATSVTSSANAKHPEETLSSPITVNTDTTLPPKPIKKRFLEHVVDNKNVSRNIFINETTNATDTNDIFTATNAAKNNMTKQEIIEKVVDSLCSAQNDDHHYDASDRKKETRKSGRSCKGKRYEKFMVEGKLLGNKKDKKDKQKSPVHGSGFDLETTIKRLSERTKRPSLEGDTETNDSEFNNNNNNNNNNDGGGGLGVGKRRARTNSETSTETVMNIYRASDFNLEAKIKALPNLSFEKFLTKKKLAKKKKPANKIRNGDEPVAEHIPVGSRKRKANKHIVRIPSPSNDLSGLATLAEVAAKTAKIDQQQQ